MIRIDRYVKRTYVERYSLDLDKDMVQRINDRINELLVRDKVPLTDEDIASLTLSDEYDSKYDQMVEFKYSFEGNAWKTTIRNCVVDVVNDYLWDCYVDTDHDVEDNTVKDNIVRHN